MLSILATTAWNSYEVNWE